MGSDDLLAGWDRDISLVSRLKYSAASLVRPSFTRDFRLCHAELKRSADPLSF